LLAWLAANPAWAETRVALVIGNAAYQHAPALANPINDASGVAAALRRLGFEVVEATDLDKSGMQRALHDFVRLLEDADVGLFFYAGHALQVDGQNYLAPVDAVLERRSDLEFEALEVELVLRLLQEGPETSLVFLDACRDNPLSRSLARSLGAARSQAIGRGLANVNSGIGTLIAYATQPDNVALDGKGHHSPFTAALLEHIETPGLEVRQMLSRVRRMVIENTAQHQVPWDNSSLTGDFFFLPPQPEQAPSSAGAPTHDRMAWEVIKESQDPADFGTFLEAYPDSPMVPWAQRKVRTLQPARAADLPPSDPAPGTTAPEPAPTADPATGRATSSVAALPQAAAPAAPEPDPPAVETALGLSPAQRQEIQVALSALGHDTRGADGVLGRNTRAALSQWQQARGEVATGYLTAVQHRQLLAEAAPKLAALAVVGQSSGPPAPVQPAVGVYHQNRPGTEFRDCHECPEMVVVPAGSFLMGSPPSEQGRLGIGFDEGPQHTVTIRQPFAVGRYEVTFNEWDACMRGSGCNEYQPSDQGWGGGRRPVINVSWDDAQVYVRWLSQATGEPYRLLSEAEWEYAARAGTTTRYSWGDNSPTRKQANFDMHRDVNFGRTTKVGSRLRNPWGLHDMHGNVWEWVEDCWNEGYQGAPSDGSAWTSGNCTHRVLRGGSWLDGREVLRSAFRGADHSDGRSYGVGFRVARPLR
jgi:formylglycine-generating enzyme required for sulfatase activity